MTKPWGEVAIADAHVHFFSHRFFELLAAQRGIAAAEAVQTLGWDAPPANPDDLAALWVAELDRRGVSKAVLIGSLPGEEISVIAARKAHPDRFFAFSMVNPLAEGAAARVTAAMADCLQGVCFFPAMHRYSMHDARVLEILESLKDRKNVAIFVHCGVLSVGVRKKLGLPSQFDMQFSNPLDLHALALQFPSLPFIVPHFGAGFLRETLMLADLCPNVYLDTSSTNSWMRYQESGCTLESVFERALAVAGPKRLLFGTDSSFFPRGWHKAIFDRQVHALESLQVSPDDARDILGGNLVRLLAS